MRYILYSYTKVSQRKVIKKIIRTKHIMIFMGKKNPRIIGSVQSNPVLSKGQVHYQTSTHGEQLELNCIVDNLGANTTHMSQSCSTRVGQGSWGAFRHPLPPVID